jgi:hypothetical protein
LLSFLEVLIFALVILYVMTAYVLARRLHRLDPDLTVFQYFKRIWMAQWPAALYGEGLREKPNGEPVHEAFMSYVLILVGFGIAYLILGICLTLIFR